MNLFDYQKHGVDWLQLERNRFLASDPGLGKTAMAITAAMDAGALSILVVCPAVARTHWETEFAKWWPGHPSVSVISPGQSIRNADIIIVSYDYLSRATGAVMHMIANRKWDLLICDEAHFLKNKGANRTKRVYGAHAKMATGLAPKAYRVWLLSGTPTPNHAGELWTHLRALFPESITKNGKPLSELQFQDKFCKVAETPFGRQIKGSKNLSELKTAIDPHFLRQKKADVLPDLPPLRFDTEHMAPIDLNTASQQMLKDALANVPSDILDMEGDALLRALTEDVTALAAERRLIGLAKLPLCVEWVHNELQGNHRKLIIFAWHKELIAKAMKHLADYSPVCIVGETSQRDRDMAISKFQTDPTCRVFLGNIRAAGTAITLTAASDVVFFESSWTPNDNYQAACRAHRIGQNDGVLARTLCLKGTLDEKIERVLTRKANEISQLFG